MRFDRLIKKFGSLGLAPIHRSFSDSFKDSSDKSVCVLEKITFNELKGKVFYYKMVPVADREDAQRFAAIGAPLVVRSLQTEDGFYGYYDSNENGKKSDNNYGGNEAKTRNDGVDFDDDDFDDDDFSFSKKSKTKTRKTSIEPTKENEEKNSEPSKENDESSSDEFDFEKAEQSRIEKEFESQYNPKYFYDSSGEAHPVWEKEVKSLFREQEEFIPPPDNWNFSNSNNQSSGKSFDTGNKARSSGNDNFSSSGGGGGGDDDNFSSSGGDGSDDCFSGSSGGGSGDYDCGGDDGGGGDD